MLPISSTTIRLTVASLALATAAVGATTVAAPDTAHAAEARASAHHSHHAHRVSTSLSVHVIDGPAADRVAGRLRTGSHSLRGRAVVLLAGSPGQDDWRFVASRRTDRHGEVAFKVGPDASGYRLQFLGTTGLRPASSRAVQVAPAPMVSIAPSPQTVDLGSATSITGVVTSGGVPVAGAAVDLLSRSGSQKTFHHLGTALTGADGTVAISDAPTRDTTYRLHVRETGTTSEGLSPLTQVTVRAPSSLSIRGLAFTGGYAVTGVLVSQGEPVAGELVTLMGQAPGSTVWVAAGSSTTDRHGAVAFTPQAASGTTYRLDFAGTARLAATTSGTVVG